MESARSREYYTTEHMSDMSKPPEITHTVHRGRAHSRIWVPTDLRLQSAHGNSSLGPSSARQRDANDHLDGLDRGADGPGAGGHACEQSHGAMDVNVVRSCGRWQRTCASSQGRFGSPNEDEAVEGAPCPKIALPTRPLLPLLCPRSSSPATVKKAAQLQAAASNVREDVTSEHEPRPLSLLCLGV